MTNLPYLPALLAIAITTTQAACQQTGGPDFGPIGDGIAFLGISVLCAMLLFVMNSQRQP